MFRDARVTLLLLIAFSLFSSQAFSRDRSEDYHVTADPSRVLYQNSAFAHGHRHGYEKGYHDADLDFQFGHSQRTFKNMHNVPRATGYHESFGSRDTFREGYKYGYVAGYADGYEGRDFRLITASGLAQTDREFDAGLAAGFRYSMTNSTEAMVCKQEAVRASRPGFCSGFEAGMAMAVAQRKASDVVDVAAESAHR